MIRNRKLLQIFLITFFAFVISTVWFMVSLTQTEERGQQNFHSSKEIIESEIYKILGGLPSEYKTQRKEELLFDKYFLKNTEKVIKIENFNEIWKLANSWVSKEQLYDMFSPRLGEVIEALKVGKIRKADIDSRGTQLKLLLTLEGEQQVIFKPKWYEEDKIIEGPVYAGKDRYNAEILAFYLSAVLNKPLVPISVKRVLNIKSEVLPVASKRLRETSFQHKNRTCIYGQCYYCKKEDSICESDLGQVTGTVIFNIKNKLKQYRAPWQRTYSKTKKATWETNDKFCRVVFNKLAKQRIYDLIDVAIFDFLIQNGDRHHYETLDNNVIYLDNGKGLGNPFVHHIDILAPLYQCCILRNSTWQNLLALAGGLLEKKLKAIPEIKNTIDENHIKSIDERLLIVFATVEYCKKKSKNK